MASVCWRFEQTHDYPDVVLRHHNVRYALAGHWEDFFQPRTDTLKPVRVVLDGSATDRFLDIVESDLGSGRGVAPLIKSEAECASRGCGPHGATWSLPVPGETFHFQTGPQRSAPSLDVPGPHASH